MHLEARLSVIQFLYSRTKTNNYNTIGINQGMDYLIAENLPEIYPDCVFAVFEEFKAILYADESYELSVIEPILGGLKKEVAPLYDTFNDEPGRTMEYGSIKKKTTKSPLNPKSADDIKILPSQRRKSKLGKGVMYNATHVEHVECEKILKIFHDAFVTHIIKHIPPKPIYRHESKVTSIFWSFDFAFVLLNILNIRNLWLLGQRFGLYRNRKVYRWEEFKR